MVLDEASVPFAATAIVLVAGAASSWAVQKRVVEYAQVKNAEAERASRKKLVLPPYLFPKELPKLASWGVDTAQAVVAAATPLVTGLLLVEHRTTLVDLGYCASFVIAIVCFIALLYARPDQYARLEMARVSVVSWGAILLNVLVVAAINIF